MTWGIPTATFLQIHVAISLIGILAGLVVFVAAVPRDEALRRVTAAITPR